MSFFAKQIKSAAPTSEDIRKRRWIFVAYDRLTDGVGPLSEQSPKATGIVMVESKAKGERRPYHKKKLVLLLANMRHFALEQAERGVSVVYLVSPQSYGQGLIDVQREYKLPVLDMMRPAERELRIDLSQAVAAGLIINELPDPTWLSTTQDFIGVFGEFASGRKYVMDRFYRKLRQQTGILMKDGQPVGGKYSFDAENRKPYRGEPPVPIPPNFPPDELTREVIALVEREFSQHFGLIEGFDLPTTQADCDRAWEFALRHLLPNFGPYEDAMRDDQLQLFHSRMSALINLGRLLPAKLVSEVEHAAGNGAVPLASAEGFIRQILGWREFMRHVHEQTDGYRKLRVPQEKVRRPGRKTPDKVAGSDVQSDVYAGAKPSALDASLPLPAVYWGVKSGLNCIDTVVEQVVREGWSHHITRLMVLSNLATLCGFSPRELTDWFWFAYVDAYDWVVEPNVLGMSTYADGGVTATKPYISGAAYINRMSNYCGGCKFDPKKSTGPGSCPFTALYWTFLQRNQATLGDNFRLQMPYRTLEKKSAKDLIQLRTRAEEAIEHLQSFPRPEY